jgi:hypothetical protein
MLDLDLDLDARPRCSTSMLDLDLDLDLDARPRSSTATSILDLLDLALHRRRERTGCRMLVGHHLDVNGTP